MDEKIIKAVLFDFDDTLQDRKLAFAGYCRAFLDRYFPTLQPAEHATRMEHMENTVNGGYIDRTVYFTALIAHWNWTDAPAPAALSAEYDETFGDYVCPFPASAQVLTALKRRGYKVGIITNGPSILQNAKLDASGLRPLLDIAVVSSDVGVAKPDPGIFLLTARRLGVAPQHCLYVGDHPVNDIQGALAAGMQVLWMQYGTFRDQIPVDVEKIDSIAQVLELL